MPRPAVPPTRRAPSSSARRGGEGGAESDAGELHERSRFVRLRGRWYYLDGDVG